ncbi:MAG TPA: transaldolase [Woeseiaceae bacterium]|nr:transaldolase [Woeseiaceae bacterium]
MTSPLRTLNELGQSVWLDDLRRDFLIDGTLAALIDQDGVSGLTSNPAIFANALDTTDLYDADIERYARSGDDAETIYERLIIDDIQQAADLLRPRYEASSAHDGYVSLEVSPHLATDAAATLKEGKQLWSQVERPNLMIKVPATSAGLPAIEALIAAGINVNVTLLFSVSRYRDVLAAYWRGLEARVADGHSIARVASVASFFVSRIDALIDRQLESEPACMATGIRGKAAIACAKLAYQAFRASLDDPRWQALAGVRAQPQRLLWASTGTKDVAYSDVKYVEALIGPDTVTTLPMGTLQAYRDHGEPQSRVANGMDWAAATLSQLAVLDIDLDDAARQLEREGIEKFKTPFDRLIANINGTREQIVADRSGHLQQNADEPSRP